MTQEDRRKSTKRKKGEMGIPDSPKGSSLQRMGDVLLPFLVYFAVHDLASVLLAFLMGMSLSSFGESYREFITAHAASMNGILNGAALCIGMAATLPMARKELQWRAVKESNIIGQKASMRLHSTKGIYGGCAEAAGKEKSVGQRGVEYILLILCAVSLAIGMNLLLHLAGLTEVSENYTEISTRQYGVAFGLGLVLYGVVSPAAEEMVFRGLIYNRMKRYFKTGLSILVSGVLFGIYHGNLVQGIYGCVLGIAITLMYEWYGSILAPILFHGAANVSVFVMSYDAEVFRGIVTPLNCVIFLIISILAGMLIGKMNKFNNKN